MRLLSSSNGGQNMHQSMEHVFTRALVRKHVYHPFVHILTPKMADRRRACMRAAVVQWVYTQYCQQNLYQSRADVSLLDNRDSLISAY